MQKSQKLPSGHHRTNLSGYIFATKAHIDSWKKQDLLSSNIFATRPRNMANFGELAAEIGSLFWGTLANFKGLRVFAALLQRRRSPEAKVLNSIVDYLISLPEANQSLHDIWPSPGLVHYMYIFGALAS